MLPKAPAPRESKATLDVDSAHAPASAVSVVQDVHVSASLASVVARTTGSDLSDPIRHADAEVPTEQPKGADLVAASPTAVWSSLIYTAGATDAICACLCLTIGTGKLVLVVTRRLHCGRDHFWIEPVWVQMRPLPLPPWAHPLYLPAWLHTSPTHAYYDPVASTVHAAFGDFCMPFDTA